MVGTQKFGITPNIGDKRQRKRLWVGRLRHLLLLLKGEDLRKMTSADSVRASLTQLAMQFVDQPEDQSGLRLVTLAEMDDQPLELLARVSAFEPAVQLQSIGEC